MNSVDVAVIGAGPAGMAAAIEAAARGLRVAVIDEQLRIGGKIGISVSAAAGFSEMAPVRVERMMDRFRKGLQADGDRITCLFGTQVWHVDKDHRLYLSTLKDSGAQDKVPSSLQARAVILAQGAIERHIPFPGWTVPGVMAVGGLGLFLKQGIVPRKRIWIAGSGPLQLALLRDLCAVGHPPAGVVLPFSRSEMIYFGMRSLPWMGTERMRLLVALAADRMRWKIPVYFRTVVHAAHGSDQLSAIDLRSIDSRWRLLPTSDAAISADILAVGYGIVPSCELSRRCGCLHVWDEHADCWKPLRDRWLETSVPGIWSVGDGAVVLGYDASWLEGRVAGIAASAFLGKILSAEADRSIAVLGRRLVPFRRMGRWIETVSKPRPGIWERIPDDTIVCRCETVRAGDIRAAVAKGASDIGEIKRRTRLGMGQCQDRICSQCVQELIARYRKAPIARDAFFPRIPARPVPFEDMARIEITEDNPNRFSEG
uniref:FAD-dependent oxidoreductase n=1 Tax=Desulfatirhabdium butyrativorans TaxID=340467 RepID=A0A7C4VR15_9BACT